MYFSFVMLLTRHSQMSSYVVCVRIAYMGANDCLYSNTTDIYVKVYVTVCYFETCQIFPQKLSDRKGTKALFAGRKKQ